MNAQVEDEEFESALYRIYEDRKPLYSSALSRVKESLEAILHDRGRHTVAEQRRMRVEFGRVKEANRLLVKAALPKYTQRIVSPESVFNVITDIAGIRITCNTYEDVRRIESAILESNTLRLFGAVEASKVHEDYLLDPKPSGYRAVHLLVEVDVPLGANFIAIPCEVQIRTLLQHAWGELTHEDTFKPEIAVPPLVSSLSKRLATALAVLDEIAQDLRDELNKIEKGTANKVAPEESADENVQGVVVTTQDVRTLYEAVFGRVLSAPNQNIRETAASLSASNLDSSEHVQAIFERVYAATKDPSKSQGVLVSDAKMLQIILDVVSESVDAETVVLREHQNETRRLGDMNAFADLYRPGTLHMATVMRVAPRFAVCQLTSGAQAVVSARHLERGNRRISLEDFLAPGETVRIRVITVSPERRRIEAATVYEEPNAAD
ncbi:hypothetical protein [Arthrobacter sp. 92]|uniref:hypothetical protein n=1 Tax=Arthrobacter sp. 92 TaxID=3418175 RepID=UPI003CFCBFA5